MSVPNPYLRKNQKKRSRPVESTAASTAASTTAPKNQQTQQQTQQQQQQQQQRRNRDIQKDAPPPPPLPPLPHAEKRPRNKTWWTITDEENPKDSNSKDSNSKDSVSEEASALIISASAKAGMEGISKVDRRQIDAIILRESNKGSRKFMLQQLKRDEKVNARILAYQTKIRQAASPAVYAPTPALEARLTHWQQQSQHQQQQQQQSSSSSSSSRTTKVVVDMDMFYMACELLTQPDLYDVPACVGNGMILTSNYAARKFGVRSAMPGWIGDQLVHEISGGALQLIHVPSHFGLYKEKSTDVMAVLRQFDPHMNSYSLDEAYLEMGPYLALYLVLLVRQGGGPSLKKKNDDDDDDAAPSNVQKQQPSQTQPSVRNNKEGYDNNIRIRPPICEWDHEQIRTTLQERRASSASSSSTTTTPSIITSTTTKTSSTRTNSDHANDDHDDHDDASILQSVSTFVCRQALERIVHYMRACVCHATGGLTCSAGMAPTMTLAKIASDRHKPNGQCFVDPSGVLAFCRPLAVRQIPGIGRVTEKILQHLPCAASASSHGGDTSIRTVQDLYDHRGLIHWLFPPATRDFLLKASVGCSGGGSGCGSTTEPDEDGVDQTTATTTTTTGDKATTNTDSHQKGMSRERTFSSNDDWTQLNSKLQDVADGLSNDLQQKQLWAKTITVKAKLDTFEVYSRSKTYSAKTTTAASHYAFSNNVATAAAVVNQERTMMGDYLQSSQQLLAIAAPLLTQIRRDWQNAQNAQEIDQKASSASTEPPPAPPQRRRTHFSCRLLGIRCSNLLEEEQVVLALQQHSSQETLDKFFLTASTASNTGDDDSKRGARSPSPMPTGSQLATRLPTKRKTAKAESSKSLIHIFQRTKENSASPERLLEINTTSASKRGGIPVDERFADSSFFDHPREKASEGKPTAVSPEGLIGFDPPAQNDTPSNPIGVVTPSSSTSIDNDSKSPTLAPIPTTYVQCPLCQQQQFLASDNDALNQHIDTCLNGSTVRQAVREASRWTTSTSSSSSDASNKSHKRQRLTDFW